MERNKINKKTPIRVRFAPSPTGYMHIGGIRTALYTFLIAKQNNGAFIIRIEDTDTKRYVKDSEVNIFKALKQAGLDYDEGGSKGGPFGPYKQSERKDIYQKHGQELIDRGGAYRCFCDNTRINTLREEAKKLKRPYKYDGVCKKLTKDDVEKNLKADKPFVIRQNIPSEGITEVEDEVYGSWKVNNSDLEEGILIKSDGLPTYNFANVIDDHLMQMSHVIRGSEYISSAPKYILLYQAFDWDIPKYIHLPLITKSDGKKLSKRSGDATFEDLIKKGYLSEAIINYIALLGWNPGTNEEIFTLDELIKVFSIKGIHKSPAIFDNRKLSWVNSEHIKKLDIDTLSKMVKPYLISKIKEKYQRSEKEISSDLITKISTIEQPRMSLISEVGEDVGFYFQDELNYDKDLLLWKKYDLSEISESLQHALKIVSGLSTKQCGDLEYLKELLLSESKKYNKDRGLMLWPMRVALTGQQNSPSPFEALWLLGKERSEQRIQNAIDMLS